MWTARRLYSAEKILCVSLIITILIYAISSVPFRRPLELYGSRLLHGMLLYGVGLVLALLILRLKDIRRGVSKRKETWSRYQELYLNFKSLGSDLRLIHVIALMFVVFIHLKHIVPIINHHVFDSFFDYNERLLFGGLSATELIQQGIGSTASLILSSWYTAFYPYIAIIVFTMILQRSFTLKAEFVSLFVMTWLLGVLIVLVVPTWGPCFFNPQSVSHLLPSEVSEMQASLWQQKLYLDQNPRSATGIYLISGFPSLHLAIVILGSIYLRRIHWVLSLLSWVFCGVTMITTLYFGWHYLADDLGSFLLVGAVLALRRFLA